MTSEIAVIMSVYKNDKIETLRVAINSLKSQTLVPDIYVWEDGLLEEEVQVYLHNELDVTSLAFMGQSSRNEGLASALNHLLGVVRAKGYRYIARMDADDIAMPNRIALQYRYMESHPDVDVVGGYIEEFGDDFDYQKIVTYPQEHQAMFNFFSKRVPLAHVTAFFHSRFFEKAGLYPTESPTNEDTLMWMRGFASGCRFANVPEVLVRVRVSSEFFGRRGGTAKAWSDLKDRIKVIRTLGYNVTSYGYAVALFAVNISPAWLKQILYKRLR